MMQQEAKHKFDQPLDFELTFRQYFRRTTGNEIDLIKTMIKELGGGASLKYFVGQRPPIKKVGINFGAPGDRKEDGTLWLEFPANQGPSPEIRLQVLPEDTRIFNHDPSWLESDEKRWL